MNNSLPAPKNTIIDTGKIIIDGLVQGVGVDLVIALAVADQPWLAWPVVSNIFRMIVEKLSGYIDQNLYYLLVQGTIRMQSELKKDEFNAAIIPIISETATPEDLAKARAAADGLIERNRP